MNKQYADPNSPWNPRTPAAITPTEFELLVVDWVKAFPDFSDSEVVHQAKVEGEGGEYAIDIRIRKIVLAGAVVDFLLECKHQKRPVERDEVLILEGKLRDTGAHKGIIFSTSGFQKGAIDYAAAHGIATVTVFPEEWLYETKDLVQTPPPASWPDLPKLFAGIRLTPTENGVSSHVILPGYLDALSDFLRSSEAPTK